MTGRPSGISGPPGRLRRCWPQKVRTRLTLAYAALFLIAGSVLLGLTYGLVASSLPAKPKTPGRPGMSEAEFIRLCKNPATRPRTARKVPDAVLNRCKETFTAGADAGSADQRQRALHNLLLFSLAGLAVMTFTSGGAGWIVSGRVLRPVRAITETARRASEQHLGERIGLTGARDELKELADTFDAMLERLDQAFAAQRRFVADASHELRTPLTVMRTAIDVTLAKPARTAEQLDAMAQRVRGCVGQAENTINALLTLAISDQGRLPRREPFDLATAAEDALDAASADIGRLRLRVDSELDPAETIGDPHLLDAMIANLVDNAVRHNEPEGWIRLRTGHQDGTAFLRIANGGRLIPPDAVATLFEPFRRMESRTGSGDGVGLGLSIAASIAKAHGAAVIACSQPAGGLDIRVTLSGTAPGREF